MYGIITYKRLAATAAATSFIILCASLLSAFSQSGLFIKDEARLMVIMYHQISENKRLWGNYVIPESLLRSDFQYMKDNDYNPVSIDDLSDFCSGKGSLPDKAVLITFDDGEKSFITKVVPLLTEYNYPAVVSVVGALTELYTENGETDDRYAYLNLDDIKKLFGNPLVEIGHHSYNMHTLGKRRGMGKQKGESESAYKSVITADIDRLQNLLIDSTGSAARVLAYPYGIRNDLLMNTAIERGFTVTLTCRECVNTLKADGDLYELGRFNRPYGEKSETFFTTRDS